MIFMNQEWSSISMSFCPSLSHIWLLPTSPPPTILCFFSIPSFPIALSHSILLLCPSLIIIWPMLGTIISRPFSSKSLEKNLTSKRLIYTECIHVELWESYICKAARWKLNNVWVLGNSLISLIFCFSHTENGNNLNFIEYLEIQIK